LISAYTPHRPSSRGRGTRLSHGLFGPGQHKEFFYVFDFCQNFEFFNQNPNTVEGKAADSLSKRLFTLRVDLIDTIDKADVRRDEPYQALRRDTAVRLQEEVAGMNVDNFIVRPKRRYVEKYTDPGAWGGAGPDRQDRADRRGRGFADVAGGR